MLFTQLRQLLTQQQQRHQRDGTLATSSCRLPSASKRPNKGDAHDHADADGDFVEGSGLGEVPLADFLAQVLATLTRLEAAVADLVEWRTVKEYYTTDEVAVLLGKATFTVREWCRLGRVHATKRACGRGPSQEWMISHDELTRIRNEGLLPLPKY